MNRVPPPVIALAFGLVQRRFTGPRRPPHPRRTAGTVLLTAASAVVAGTASAQFQRRGTTVDPLHPENASTLVTTGANRISRNPMYVGMSGLLLAHAVWRGRWAALLPAIGFVALIDRTQIEAEEAALTKKFGAEYDAYRDRTPRWLDGRSLAGLTS